jgi:His/Glu/Gln/Arg/opine family amino acid ABC transporter permease subunit
MTMLLRILPCLLFCFFLLNLPAQGQRAWDRVRTQKELVIATDATYPPFEYKENGEVKGFDVDLGTEIGRALGVKVIWLNLPWDGVLGALESGKADLVMSGVTITDERKKKGYTFSRPYFLSGQTIARRKNDYRINGIHDLKDKTVSVQAETTGQFALEKIGVPKDRILKFDQLQDGLLDVRNGKSDAAVADMPVLQTLLRKSYPELELVGGTFIQENLGIVAWRGETNLIAAVNRALETILTDGRYATIYARWIQEPLTTRILGGLDRARDAGSPVPELPLTTRELPGSTETPASKQASAVAIRWDLLRDSLKPLLRGARMTILITALTLAFGVPLGLLIALLRLAHFPPLRFLMAVYVEIVRGTPLLMQIYVIYFVLPALFPSLQFPPLLAGALALSLNAAAYCSEIFRAGIESIDSGQMEAARSLGMDYTAAMRWVILPQTFRRVLPPLTNESVALLKDSSLVSVVALAELMRVGKELATNAGSPITIYFTVALLYLALTLPLTFLVRHLEHRWQPVSRPRAKA